MTQDTARSAGILQDETAAQFAQARLYHCDLIEQFASHNTCLLSIRAPAEGAQRIDFSRELGRFTYADPKSLYFKDKSMRSPIGFGLLAAVSLMDYEGRFEGNRLLRDNKALQA